MTTTYLFSAAGFVAGLVLAVLWFAWHDFSQAPDLVRLRDESHCQNAATRTGVDSYLSDNRRRAHAIRYLVRLRRSSYVTETPPTIAEQLYDDWRADYLYGTVSRDAVRDWVCAAPIVRVGDHELIGIPSIASAVFGTEHSAEEMFLATCGALNSDRGARRALITGYATRDFGRLSAICKNTKL
jgi:hypothetical protein